MKYRTPSYAADTFDVYVFEKNLHGDIIAIYDDTTAKVVEYIYDAWGNAIVDGAEANTLGTLNPFRYRSYYFDNEIGFYYVNSRYYNAEWGRFLNADSFLTTGQGLISYNMFAYCLNDPVNRIDVGGMASVEAFDEIKDPFERDLLEGGGGAYTTYLLRSAIAAYDSALGGYHVSSLPSTYGNLSSYYVPGAVSVTDDMATDPKTPSACFVAGTLVITEFGYVPIEQVSVGDLVVAHNPETGETALKAVVNTFINEATELVHIVVNGEEIICTEEHPFYSPIKGWIAACDLRAGDTLATLDGVCTVEQAWHETLETAILVYNFEVEDYHTYYVEDVLVHNQCEPTNKSSINNQAESLGYSKVTQKSFPHGQRVYYNSKASRNMRYISYDADGHIGGAWKAASSVRDLYSKTTRSGTYNWDLTERIGD